MPTMNNPLGTLADQVATWGRKIGRGRFIWRTLQRQMAKRILRRDLVLALPNGRSVFLPRNSEFSSVAWVMNGLVDDGCETVLHGLHPAGTAFCDIGAHFGFYAVWMSDLASAVYAFEPDPRLHAALDRNLGGLANGRVVRAALTRESGRIEFIQAESAPHSKIRTDGGPGPAGRRIEVPATSLDDFWNKEGRPMIGSMKIDTEGHENLVFAGGAGCIRQCRPLILVETDVVALQEYWRVFAGLGYRLGLLGEKVAGQATACWFGRIGEVPFAQGMLFLVPPTITETDFRTQVDRLGGRV